MGWYCFCSTIDLKELSGTIETKNLQWFSQLASTIVLLKLQCGVCDEVANSPPCRFDAMTYSLQ